MKKTVLTLFCSSLLLLSPLFTACNANPSLSDQNNNQQNNTSSTNEAYDTVIRDLKNQMLELQQAQYIADAENQQEVARLETLLSTLEDKLSSLEETQDQQDTQGTQNSNKPNDQQNNQQNNNQSSNQPSGGNTDDAQPPSSDTEDTGTSSVLFSYIRQNGSITITGYSGTDERVVIPTKIDGYAVTEIADSAFRSDKIKDIVIPEGVTKIGWFAFQGCTSLKSVTIPSSVIGIGYSAFPSGIYSVTIYCHKDSFAQKYAQSYGISYAFI